MRTGGSRHFFPLTSLQIGDLQSYLSCLTLFLPPESNSFFILVDNRPWLISRDSRPAYLWQLMVTNSRLSPFANNRARRERKNTSKRVDSSDTSKSERKSKGRRLFFSNNSRLISRNHKILQEWFAVVDGALSQEKALLPMKKLKSSFLFGKKLHHTFFGFIVFEIEWHKVRGINYLNDLQTDTSMALEAKRMKRWEFDSIEQAASSISSWFSGTAYEHFLLREYLERISATGDVFYDAQEDIPVIHVEVAHDKKGGSYYNCSNISNDCSNVVDCVISSPYTPPPSGPYKRRKVIRSPSSGNTADESYSEIISAERDMTPVTDKFESKKGDFLPDPSAYKDVLVLFRFNDRDLPFMLKDVIVSDLRLLTLLEYGLPSWVIFLQSYPLFCKIYRPWMCPLARALYVLISITTVVIGFYDLYKNVPLLKATASRLLGPFFDWIESWEMVSRIKYLGTMLFLHNFEKAIKWFLMSTGAFRSLLSIVIGPISGPLIELADLVLPYWNVCFEMTESLVSELCIFLGSSGGMVADILQVVTSPFSYIFSILWEIATSILYPVMWVLWELLKAPFSFILSIVWVLWELFKAPFYLTLSTGRCIVMLFAYTCQFLKEAWLSISCIFQFASTTETASNAYEVSMWRSLWNDLFSQVFRAVRSILYGFVAFFSTCNRHRLSIYNHIREFFLHLSCANHRQRHSNSACIRRIPRTQNIMEESTHRGSKPLPFQEELRRSRKEKGSKLD